MSHSPDADVRDILLIRAKRRYLSGEKTLTTLLWFFRCIIIYIAIHNYSTTGSAEGKGRTGKPWFSGLDVDEIVYRMGRSSLGTLWFDFGYRFTHNLRDVFFIHSAVHASLPCHKTVGHFGEEVAHIIIPEHRIYFREAIIADHVEVISRNPVFDKVGVYDSIWHRHRGFMRHEIFGGYYVHLRQIDEGICPHGNI